MSAMGMYVSVCVQWLESLYWMFFCTVQPVDRTLYESSFGAAMIVFVNENIYSGNTYIKAYYSTIILVENTHRKSSINTASKEQQGAVSAPK